MTQLDTTRAAPATDAAAAPAASAQPVLSICIPTYNRARLLGPLLRGIARDAAGLGDLVEVIVSDNGSPDDTAEVCAASGLDGRLRYFRHPENRGGLFNYGFALEQARGKYALYLADDDILFWPALLKALMLLEETPGAVSLYAPWYLVDLVADQISAQFYHHADTRTFTVEDRAAMARFVLENRVFSEIAIHRADILRHVRPLIDPTAFWAFTMPAEMLGFGTVIYSPEPFYGSVTRHPGADDRTQAGNEETMAGWDRYRGGAEHLIGLSGANEAERAELRALAERLVEERMLVALRMRLGRGRDPIGNYFLGSRLRGLGREADLPVPMDALALRAAIAFLEGRALVSREAERLVLVGAFSEKEAGWVADAAALPVEMHAPGRALGPTDVALIAGTGAPADCAADLAGAGHAVTMLDLMAKFP